MKERQTPPLDSGPRTLAACRGPVQGDIVLRTLARFDPSFNKVINKIEQVSDLVNKLNKKPLNIFGKSGGPGGDIAAKQLKGFQDAIRDVANSGDDAAKRVKLLGNTVATTAEKAQVFAQALDNVKLKSGGLSRQEAAVKTGSRLRYRYRTSQNLFTTLRPHSKRCC